MIWTYTTIRNIFLFVLSLLNVLFNSYGNATMLPPFHRTSSHQWGMSWHPKYGLNKTTLVDNVPTFSGNAQTFYVHVSG